MANNYSNLISSLAGTASAVALKAITSKSAFKGAVIGSLGQLPFVCSQKKVLTFSELSKESSVRWAKHDVIGKKPVLEYVGPDLSTISITIRFDSFLGVPPIVGLNRLKRMMENRQYKTLIIGGECLGRYVIESISEVRKIHSGAGVCQVAIATIELMEYGK